MNPYITALVLASAGAIIILPRKWAIVPFLLVAPVIPSTQNIEIAVFHFYIHRILLLFVWARVLFRGEFHSMRYSKIDSLMLLQFVCGSLAYIALRGSGEALVNRLGWAFDGLSIYFLMRWMIRDTTAWKRALATLAVSCLCISIPMLIEFRTDRNLFSILGGVAEFTEIRDGSIRAQGPFGHPILAGVFAANLFPLFWSLRSLGGDTAIRYIGLLAAMVIVITSSSSTPVLCLVACMIGLLTFGIRSNMRLLRWTILGVLVSIQIAWANPVWALLARVKVFGGSTGWYRYWLLDNFIRHIDEWGLLGIRSTAGWGRGLWDVTDAYVRIGVDGGLITLVVFVMIIAESYKLVGHTTTRMNSHPAAQKAVWTLGAALTGHAAGFFGVNYWDQNMVVWYLLLAIIAGSPEIFKPRSSEARSTVKHLCTFHNQIGAFQKPLSLS